VPIYTDDSKADLENIRKQIAKDSPIRAAQKGAMIDDTCKLFDKVPKMGRVYSGTIRVFPKESWIIVYEPTKAGAIIHRVFDSRQDWRSQFP